MRARLALPPPRAGPGGRAAEAGSRLTSSATLAGPVLLTRRPPSGRSDEPGRLVRFPLGKNWGKLTGFEIRRPICYLGPGSWQVPSRISLGCASIGGEERSGVGWLGTGLSKATLSLKEEREPSGARPSPALAVSHQDLDTLSIWEGGGQMTVKKPLVLQLTYGAPCGRLV